MKQSGQVKRFNKLFMVPDIGIVPETDPVVPVAKTSDAVARKRAVKGKSWLNCRPISIGSCAGQASMPNSAFETLVDTNDAWISKRTGIRNRHVIQPGSSLRDIAVESAKAALANSGLKAADIDLVIVATSSPDDLFGDAASVASAIGANKAAAFDLTAACSGFVFGLVTASQFMHTGAYKKVLVVGADALTRHMDWTDRGTCILFGDGSGAMVLEATESEEDSGLLGFALHSDGERYQNLKLSYKSEFTELNNPEKSSVDTGSYGKLTMNGPEVYKFAVNEVWYIRCSLYRLKFNVQVALFFKLNKKLFCLRSLM
jgi:3-oxoacyl-[acyl-carrier-protein] synthase-3